MVMMFPHELLILNKLPIRNKNSGRPLKIGDTSAELKYNVTRVGKGLYVSGIETHLTKEGSEDRDTKQAILPFTLHSLDGKTFAPPFIFNHLDPTEQLSHFTLQPQDIILLNPNIDNTTISQQEVADLISNHAELLTITKITTYDFGTNLDNWTIFGK